MAFYEQLTTEQKREKEQNKKKALKFIKKNEQNAKQECFFFSFLNSAWH